MSYIGKKNGNPNTDFLEAGGELENHDLINVDASGNLGIGTTSPQKPLQVNGDDTAPVRVVRETSDGHLIQLYKDTTVAGYIGYTSDGLYIDGESNHTGIRFGGGQYVPKDNGIDSDNGVDLGTGAARFKNLYLGGGVYLGGTGSANHLDDYEEGTFTPYFTTDSGHSGGTYSVQSGHYVKVGKLVYCRFTLALSSAPTFSGTYLVLAGLPFTVSANYDNDNIGNIPYVTDLGSSPSGMLCYQAWDGQSKAFIFEMDAGTSSRTYPSYSIIGNTTRWKGTVTYIID